MRVCAGVRMHMYPVEKERERCRVREESNIE